MSEEPVLFEPQEYVTQEVVEFYSMRLNSMIPATLTAKGLTLHREMFDIEARVREGMLLDQLFQITPRNLRIAFRMGDPKHFDGLPSLLLEWKFPDLRTSLPWCVDWFVESKIFKADPIDPKEGAWMLLVVAFLTMMVVTEFLLPNLGPAGAMSFCIWFREEGYNNLRPREKTFHMEILLRACHTFVHNFHRYVPLGTKEQSLERMIEEVETVCKKFGL